LTAQACRRKLHFVGRASGGDTVNVLIEDASGGVYKSSSARGPHDSKKGVSTFKKTNQEIPTRNIRTEGSSLERKRAPTSTHSQV